MVRVTASVSVSVVETARKHPIQVLCEYRRRTPTQKLCRNWRFVCEWNVYILTFLYFDELNCPNKLRFRCVFSLMSPGYESVHGGRRGFSET